MFMARKLLDFKLLLSLYFTFIENLSNQKKDRPWGQYSTNVNLNLLLIYFRN